MRVLVAGAVAWRSAEAIRRELARLPPGSVVVHGDCAGADALAGQVGRELGLAVERWAKSAEDGRRFGKKEAWKGLNERMLASGVGLVLVFHEGLGDPGKARGSRHLMELAAAAGVETRGITQG